MVKLDGQSLRLGIRLMKQLEKITSDPDKPVAPVVWWINLEYYYW